MEISRCFNVAMRSFFLNILCVLFMNEDDASVINKISSIEFIFFKLKIVVFNLYQSGKSKCQHVFDWRQLNGFGSLFFFIHFFEYDSNLFTTSWRFFFSLSNSTISVMQWWWHIDVFAFSVLLLFNPSTWYSFFFGWKKNRR